MSAPAIGAFFAGAAGKTAIGSILTGAASGFIKGRQEKEAEKRQVREEERREGRYTGLGEATRYSESNTAERGRFANSQSQEKLGERSDVLGTGLGSRTRRARTRAPRYGVDRETNSVVYNG